MTIQRAIQRSLGLWRLWRSLLFIGDRVRLRLGAASPAWSVTPPARVLPGVTVEVASPVLIEGSRSTITDSDGQYQMIDLRPGDYTVTFTLPGFRAVRREGIRLTAAFTATVNTELQVGQLEESITVSAHRRWSTSAGRSRSR